MAQPPIPLAIYYPNGGTSASQMYVWDALNSIPIPWDGAVTFSGSISIGAITGTRTSNTAVPGSTNVGVLAGIATAIAPSYTEGFLVGLSTDLSGALRVAATISTAGLATSAKQDTGNTSLASIDGKTPALGQAVAAASSPVVLTAAQITTLTPPAAITGFATETTLSTLNGKVTAVNTGAVVISSALPAGSNAIGKLAANSGVVIGAVEIAAAQTLATVTTVSAVTAITNALPAGNNNIGDVDIASIAAGNNNIGDVDVASIAAGTNTIGAVNVKPTTAGGLLIALMSSADGSTALTGTAQAIKASAGQLFGWYIYNPNAVATYVSIYNTAAASVTVGTTNPVMTLCIPATSAANVEFTNGIEFTNAGWSAAATTTGGGNTNPSTALEANFLYK